MKKVICIQSGLMEHEGRTLIDVFGEGEGETLHEVVKDIISKYPGRGKYIKFHPNGEASDWGFPLQLLKEEK